MEQQQQQQQRRQAGDAEESLIYNPRSIPPGDQTTYQPVLAYNSRTIPPGDETTYQPVLNFAETSSNAPAFVPPVNSGVPNPNVSTSNLEGIPIMPPTASIPPVANQQRSLFAPPPPPVAGGAPKGTGIPSIIPTTNAPSPFLLPPNNPVAGGAAKGAGGLPPPSGPSLAGGPSPAAGFPSPAGGPSLAAGSPPPAAGSAPPAGAAKKQQPILNVPDDDLDSLLNDGEVPNARRYQMDRLANARALAGYADNTEDFQPGEFTPDFFTEEKVKEYLRVIGWPTIEEDWRKFQQIYQFDPTGEYLARFFQVEARKRWSKATTLMLASIRPVETIARERIRAVTANYESRVLELRKRQEAEIKRLEEKIRELGKNDLEGDNKALQQQNDQLKKEIDRLRADVASEIELEVSKKYAALSKELAKLRVENGQLKLSKDTADYEKCKAELKEAEEKHKAELKEAKEKHLEQLKAKDEQIRQLEDQNKARAEALKLSNQREALEKSEKLTLENIKLRRENQELLASETRLLQTDYKEKEKQLVESHKREIAALREEISSVKQKADNEKIIQQTKAEENLKLKTERLRAENDKYREEIAKLRAGVDVEQVALLKARLEEAELQRDLSKRDLERAVKLAQEETENKTSQERSRMIKELTTARETIQQLRQSQEAQNVTQQEFLIKSLREEVAVLKQAKQRAEQKCAAAQQDAREEEQKKSAEQILKQAKEIQSLQRQLADLTRDGMGETLRDTQNTLKEVREAARIREEFYKKRIETIETTLKDQYDSQLVKLRSEKDKASANQTKAETATIAQVTAAKQERDNYWRTQFAQLEQERERLLKLIVAQTPIKVVTDINPLNGDPRVVDFDALSFALEDKKRLQDYIFALKRDESITKLESNTAAGRKFGTLVEKLYQAWEKAAVELAAMKETTIASGTAVEVAQLKEINSKLKEQIAFYKTSSQDTIKYETQKAEVAFLTEKRALLQQIQQLKAELLAAPVQKEELALLKRKLQLEKDGAATTAAADNAVAVSALQTKILTLEREKQRLIDASTGEIAEALKREAENLKQTLKITIAERDALRSKLELGAPLDGGDDNLAQKQAAVIQAQEKLLEKLRGLTKVETAPDVEQKEIEIIRLNKQLVEAERKCSEQVAAQTKKRQEAERQLESYLAGASAPSVVAELGKTKSELEDTKRALEEQRMLVRLKDAELKLLKVDEGVGKTLADAKKEALNAREKEMQAKSKVIELQEQIETLQSRINITSSLAPAVRSLVPGPVPATGATTGSGSSSLLTSRPRTSPAPAAASSAGSSQIVLVPASRLILENIAQNMAPEVRQSLPGFSIYDSDQPSIAILNMSDNSQSLVSVPKITIWSFFATVFRKLADQIRIVEPLRTRAGDAFLQVESEISTNNMSIENVLIATERLFRFVSTLYDSTAVFSSEPTAPKSRTASCALKAITWARTVIQQFNQAVIRDGKNPESMKLNEERDGAYSADVTMLVVSFFGAVVAFRLLSSTALDEITVFASQFNTLTEFNQQFTLLQLLKAPASVQVNTIIDYGRPSYADVIKNEYGVYKDTVLPALMTGIAKIYKSLFDSPSANANDRLKVFKLDLIQELRQHLILLQQLVYYIFLAMDESKRDSLRLMDLYNSFPGFGILLHFGLVVLSRFKRDTETQASFREKVDRFTVEVQLGSLLFPAEVVPT